MKKIIITSLLMVFHLSVCAQQQKLAIGKTTVDGSALVDFGEELRGIVIAPIEDVENMSTPPSAGTIAFDGATGSFRFYDGTEWSSVIPGGLTGGEAQGIDTFQQLIGTKTSSSTGVVIFGGDDALQETQALVLPKLANGYLRFANPVPGLIYYDTVEKCIFVYNGNTWTDFCGVTNAIVGSLNNCDTPSVTGTLVEGETASSVSVVINYSGGNGASYAEQSVTSTVVTGLTATLSEGTLADGDGTLTYTITGLPNSNGNANFDINIGGVSCTIIVAVEPAAPCAGVTAPSGFGIVEAAGNCWLDRNLGASRVATSRTDAASYGHLYQWGRATDGHQIRTSNSTTTTATSATAANGLYILAGAATDNNWTNFAGEDNLWQGVNGINNPCPSGFRVPTITELSSLLASFSPQNRDGAYASPLKLPTGGSRSGVSDGIFGAGASGLYWSSTVSGTEASYLALATGNAITTSFRSSGRSVRCVKD